LLVTLRTFKDEKLVRSGNILHYAILFALSLPIGWATYERNKVWSSGEEFWLNVIKNAPGKARAYNNYAVALSEKGQYKESIPLYQKAIDMDGAYPDPLNNIAVAYSFIGDLDRAIEALKRSIMIQPLYPEAYNNLASFLITKKEYDQAVKFLDYAILIRPYYGKAFFNKGKIHLLKNEPEQAFECFKNACTKADLEIEKIH
jgi:Tfp pilus assembly protein PilF